MKIEILKWVIEIYSAKTVRKDEYKCASCRGVFEKGWSEEEAKAEAEFYFGKPVDDWKDEGVLVCDDCYNKMHPKDNPEAVAFGESI